MVDRVPRPRFLTGTAEGRKKEELTAGVAEKKEGFTAGDTEKKEEELTAEDAEEPETERGDIA